MLIKDNHKVLCEQITYEYANKPIQGFAVAMITYPRGVNQIKTF